MTIRPILVVLLGCVAVDANAQTLGTFRWQLQPYCNVVTVTVTQEGGTYRLEGTDDRCGAAEAASAIGTAFLLPDGSVGLGLNIVAAPGGEPHPVSAALALSTLSGTWRDAHQGGTFAFTPGPGTAGPPRPLPPTSGGIPSAIRFEPDGGFVAGSSTPGGAWPVNGAGVRLLWGAGRAAVRAGRTLDDAWDDASSGSGSAAFNRGTRATGVDSVAINDGTLASGAASAAFGTTTLATAARSLAVGEQSRAEAPSAFAGGAGARASNTATASVAVGGALTVASGADAAAFGDWARASGGQSAAFGSSEAAGTQAFAAASGFARGNRSVALGDGSAFGDESVVLNVATASALGAVGIGSAVQTASFANGSFVFGDRSTTAPLVSNSPNQFLARAAGGVGFYTRHDAATGVELASGGGAWAPLSDARMKENFRDVAESEVLARLARMPVREWNYTSQDASIRHLGPTAQDFRAAFGLGDFPHRINTVDADGVALAAARALDPLTRSLAERHDGLAGENARLRAVYEQLVREQQELLHRLEQLARRLGEQEP